MRVALINSVRLHHAVDGTLSGPVVAFANSLGTDLRVWDALLPHLPPGVRTLRYDMRGHGLSDAPEGDYWMGDLVADAAGLLDHLGLTGVTFVGLSIGGAVAQGLAAERPDLVRAMVLSNTAAKIGTPQMWQDRIATVRTQGLEAIADGVMERWFSRHFRETRPDDLALWRHMLTRTPRQGYAGCCAALAETDLRESTARLTLPTLAIAGSEDGATPPDLVRETAETIPGARFELIRGAGHIPCVEAPAEVGRLISAFLKDNALA